MYKLAETGPHGRKRRKGVAWMHNKLHVVRRVQHVIVNVPSRHTRLSISQYFMRDNIEAV